MWWKSGRRCKRLGPYSPPGSRRTVAAPQQRQRRHGQRHPPRRQMVQPDKRQTFISLRAQGTGRPRAPQEKTKSIIFFFGSSCCWHPCWAHSSGADKCLHSPSAPLPTSANSSGQYKPSLPSLMRRRECLRHNRELATTRLK